MYSLYASGIFFYECCITDIFLYIFFVESIYLTEITSSFFIPKKFIFWATIHRIICYPTLYKMIISIFGKHASHYKDSSWCLWL